MDLQGEVQQLLLSPMDHESDGSSQLMAGSEVPDDPILKPIPDIVILYHTHWCTMVLFLQGQFSNLSSVITTEAAREDRKNVTHAWTKARHQTQAKHVRDENTAAHPFALAALDMPKRLRTNLQKTLYDDPQARRDAEEAERTRWIQILGSILTNTQTPMCQVLLQRPQNVRSELNTRDNGSSVVHVCQVQRPLRTCREGTEHMLEKKSGQLIRTHA